MPLLDCAMVGLIISIIVVICFDKYRTNLLTCFLLGACITLISVGFYMGYRTMKLNYECIDSNRTIEDGIHDKMPIPYELAEKYVTNVEDVTKNDNRHKLMKKDDIKEYDLCDKNYTDNFPFVNHMFYSDQDTIGFIGFVMLSSGGSTLLWLVLIDAKRTSKKYLLTKANLN